eukprot:CAMPEP_0172837044 /NCGR_PEP_ID=MMETSP1075-20121228/26910_1 /TAXON_ID=2916 /ORGANISM="Ceratium fusus, Strain PA161109" /LENGTH=156 /DNA_ID=CAMNT_0013680371 /DNA_START=82 /DNA_END=553 /DNA_ORIENTATION=-
MALLRTAQNQPMMVELKNGETYSGVLASCDGFMNLHMRDIVCTSRDGERFWKIPECYVRGNSIKYLRLPDEVIDMVKDEPQTRKEIRQQFKAALVAVVVVQHQVVAVVEVVEVDVGERVPVEMIVAVGHQVVEQPGTAQASGNEVEEQLLVQAHAT